jgi:hypothetical protein
MQDGGHHETEDIMNAIPKLTVPMLVVGAMLVSAGFARAQQTTLQGAVVGTWTLVSEVAHQGEKTTLPLGPNPLGSIMLDPGGRFILMIARPNLPKFAANKRDAGTPEENKAVLAGSLAFFGTYSVNEADHVLTLHPEASTFPNWVGADQKRYTAVAGDEMKWTNRTPAIGAEVVELVWKRAP